MSSQSLTCSRANDREMMKARQMRRVRFHAKLQSGIKNSVALKDMTILFMETNKANISLEGSDTRKSSSAYLEVRIERKITIEIDEEKRATASDNRKTLNHSLFLKMGNPVVSSIPPGTVKGAAKTTVAIKVETSMHEVAVSFIHFSPSFRNSLCCSVKRSCATSPLLFLALMYE